ncbi:hypothetical protein [Leifsonia sp. AG29]|uniref:hypothetical protein n=1 Tax=Leifsonia sp. AG29 TaxID=2598860 RepID=UPI00131C97F4|nr:hypothetical protein [Leifsonia sp. AG29]
MAVFTRACDHCGKPYEASRIDSRFCRDAHRAAAARAADAELRRVGADLLRRLTRAVIEGAPERELDTILAEARRVLPER